LAGAAADQTSDKSYRYSAKEPATNWIGDDFDDSSWQVGQAPFGTIANPKTQWNSSDLWLRRTFDWNGDLLKAAALVIFYDEDTEVFVNGKKIWNRTGYVTAYEMFEVTDAIKKAIRKGRNTLAIHTHQTGGGQFIDLALLAE
jgi:hypothetical protein